MHFFFVLGLLLISGCAPKERATPPKATLEATKQTTQETHNAASLPKAVQPQKPQKTVTHPKKAAPKKTKKVPKPQTAASITETTKTVAPLTLKPNAKASIRIETPVAAPLKVPVPVQTDATPKSIPQPSAPQASIRHVYYLDEALFTQARALQQLFNPQKEPTFIKNFDGFYDATHAFFITTAATFLKIHTQTRLDMLDAKKLFWIIVYDDAKELEPWLKLHQNSYKSASITVPAQSANLELHPFTSLINALRLEASPRSLRAVSPNALESILCEDEACPYIFLGNRYLLF